MTEPRRGLKHPFWQAVALIIGAYVLFKFVVAYVPPLIGLKSAPVPASSGCSCRS